MAEPDRWSRLAVTVVFFVLGAGSGTWAARIPAVKGSLHLSAGLLGVALLGAALGAVVAMPVTGALLTLLAPRRIVQVAFIAFGASLAALSVAGSAWQLFALLLGWGAALGAIDVAMNTEAAALERHLGRRVMSRFHAGYSVGGLVGAGAGALAAAHHVGVASNLLVAGVAFGVIGIAAGAAFSSSGSPPGSGVPRGRAAKAGEGPQGPRRLELTRALVALGAMAFGCFLAEGATNDWSAVYLHTSLGAASGIAAVAYTAFSCAMAAGRLAGDHLAERVGAVRLVRISGAIATVGFGGSLLVGRVDAALVGFVLLGLGLSFVVPLVFSAAAQLGDAGPSLAAVTSCGYLGLLIGPVLIGGLADGVGLPGALGVIVALSAALVVLAGAVAPRR